MGTPGRVHEAARGFHTAAAAYERGRPEYPEDAVRYLADELHIGPGSVVLDLAAGTGKLTRALLPLGPRLIAVEPSEGMRTVFRSAVGSVEPVDGTAEAIPLPDRSVDGVVVGQAFHWFRAPEALREIARVLRPRGRLGLIWNRRDESVPWVASLGELIEAHDRRGAPRARDDAWASAFRDPGPFGPLIHRSFSQVQRLSPEGVVERVLSISFLATLPEARQKAIAAEVRAVLSAFEPTAGQSVVDLPYRTDVYVTHRMDSSSEGPSPVEP